MTRLLFSTTDGNASMIVPSLRSGSDSNRLPFLGTIDRLNIRAAALA